MYEFNVSWCTCKYTQWDYMSKAPCNSNCDVSAGARLPCLSSIRNDRLRVKGGKPTKSLREPCFDRHGA